MGWEHTCSLDWMRARQRYLTGSDIHKVVPLTPSGKRRSKDRQIDAMRDLWATKQKVITQADCRTFGDAARGHVLEPYAVEEFNSQTGYDLVHIDDTIIVDDARPRLAFSPDALNPTRNIAGEIKSYQAPAHYRCGLAIGSDGYLKLEERWQCACAMAVMDSVEVVFLILYNPSVKDVLFSHAYTREMLADEIVAIDESYQLWEQVCAELEERTGQRRGDVDPLMTEQDIYDAQHPSGAGINPH